MERKRTLELSAEVRAWLKTLTPERANRVTAAMDAVQDGGSTMGRPLVDRVKGSRVHNMKELRTGSIRVLFVFDQGEPLMLYGGDKRGAWNDWYRRAVPEAEKLYNKHRGANGKGGSSRHRDPPSHGR